MKITFETGCLMFLGSNRRVGLAYGAVFLGALAGLTSCALSWSTDLSDSRGVCTDETCTSLCSDHVKNGQESDVDCGAGCPNKCKNGQACAANGDCAIGVCADDMRCDASVCSNGTQDGDETSIDCGGRCAQICNNGSPCNTVEECTSGVCAHGLCLLGLNKPCNDHAQCASGYCKDMLCTACSMDSECPLSECVADTCKIPDGSPCGSDDACLNGKCTSNLCLHPVGDACSDQEKCISQICSSSDNKCATCTQQEDCDAVVMGSQCNTTTGNCSLIAGAYCSLAANAPQCPSDQTCNGFPSRCQ